MANLREVIQSIATAPKEATIFAAAPWTPDSEAVVTDMNSAPDGLAYLLEVDLALEVLEVWSSWRNGRVPSAHEAADAVIHYAEHDAYEPIEDA